MRGMKLIVITTEDIFEGEAEAINLLFESGLELLHVRKPHASRDEMEKLIKQLNADFYSRMVVHDHYDLAELYDLRGIHLNNRNRTKRNESMASLSAEALSGVSSFSCHSLEEVAAISRLTSLPAEAMSGASYVFLSPVFDSISKVGYKQAFTPQQLVEARDRRVIDEKVIALGGITTENIPLARWYGFGGVAVLGALWRNFATDGHVNELLRRFNELQKSV